MQFVGSVLVRNEDVFLERAIRNAAGFCDRMHVLDHMSDDGTPAILHALADELGTLDVRRSTFSGDSHKPLEPYAGTPTWVLVVDGDCIFDPDGPRPPAREPRPGRARRRLPVAGARAALRRDRRRERHRVRVHGAALASDRAALQLRRPGVVDGCHQRVHGGEPVFRPGYEWHSVRDLTESAEWDAGSAALRPHLLLAPLDCRSRVRGAGATEPQRAARLPPWPPRTLRRAVRRPALDPRVQELHRQGLNWKQAKYRRGPRVTLDAAPFRLGASAA